MKVRGNQTAGWAKKGFRIKFGGKTNLLGLNNGNKYKKWVLLADAKDTTLVRTALGLYVSRGVVSDGDNVWVSDYTPVNVYLNDQYWGFYYLCEQKEVKEGRVNLPEVPETSKSINIGYCFELDHYADSAGSQGEASEMAKGIDGDPTFRMKYSPKMEQGRPSGPLAAGQICTYTMLSDITDGPGTEHVQADYTSVDSRTGVPNSNAQKTSNSNQLTFIRDRMEALYQVLYSAAIDKKAKEINDSNEVINSSKTIQQVMEQHFNFYVDAGGDTYVENTYNTWLYLLSKLSFFVNMVKTKWNQIREAKLFENMFKMMNEHFEKHDGDIQRNHQKWPQNDAAHQPPNNFDEIREPYTDPAKYKEAEAETISWCAKRVNFLEKKWGNGRPNVSTK